LEDFGQNARIMGKNTLNRIVKREQHRCGSEYGLAGTCEEHGVELLGSEYGLAGTCEEHGVDLVDSMQSREFLDYLGTY
jgi:hypothetical protein